MTASFQVTNFRSRIQACRDMLNKHPGLDMSLGQQEKELELLKAQLKCKQYVLFHLFITEYMNYKIL